MPEFFFYHLVQIPEVFLDAQIRPEVRPEYFVGDGGILQYESPDLRVLANAEDVVMWIILSRLAAVVIVVMN